MNATHLPLSNLARATLQNNTTQTVQPGTSLAAVDLGPNVRPGEALQILYVTAKADFPEEVKAMEESFSRHQLNAGLLDLGDIQGNDLVERLQDLEFQIAQLHKNGRLNDDTIVFISMHGETTPSDQDVRLDEMSDGVENASDSNYVKNGSYMLSVLNDKLRVDFSWLISRFRNTIGNGIPYKGQIHLIACGAKRCMDLVADDGFSYVAYGGRKKVFTMDGQITCLSVIDLLGQCHRDRTEFPTPEKIAEHAASISGATVSFKTPSQSHSFSPLKSTPQPLVVNKNVAEALATRGARILEEKLAHGSADAVKKTIKKFGEQIWRHLHRLSAFEAVESKRDVIEKLSLLEDHDWFLDQVDEDGNSLFHVAAEMEDLALIDFCIDAGLNINAKNKEGERPLHVAVSIGAVDAVRRLVNEGANPGLWFISGGEKYNLLHIATGFGNHEVIKAMLESPSLEINAVTGYGQKSALHLAAEIDNGRAIGLLAAKRADLNIRDKDGNTPLHLAISSGNIKAARALLEAGANPSSANHKHLQPLMIAADKKRGQYMVSLLIFHDAQVNSRDAGHWTPLHYAARAGNLQSVKMLTNAGAKSSVINADGDTPKKLAEKYQHQSVIKFFSTFDAQS